MKYFTMCALAFVIIVTTFFGCAVPAEKLNIRDFEGFKDIPDTAAKIVVNYQDDLSGEFEITDESTVKEVMNLLLSETYARRQKTNELGAGGNSNMSVILEDGRIFKISLHRLEKSGYYYTSESSSLLGKLRELGLEYDALKAR